jgi:hypothetical protein
MQNQMGPYGELKHFQAPYRNIIYHDYPVILNILPEIKHMLGDYILSRNVDQYIDLFQDTIIRYSGTLEDLIDKTRKEMKNPVLTFRQGVQAIITFPKCLLFWLGLSSVPSVYSTNYVIKFISGVISLMTIISSFTSLVIGWNQFVRIISSFWTSITKII